MMITISKIIPVTSDVVLSEDLKLYGYGYGGLAFSAIASHMDRDEMYATSIFPCIMAPNLHELGIGGEIYQQLSRSSGQLS
jgi:hypothetical protein